MRKSAQKGFTLIELMVVIAVIAILATIALFGIGKAQQAARDTQRAQIMNGIRTGLERYYADNQKYPSATNFGAMLDLITPTYLADDPTDPKGGCTVAVPAATNWLPCGVGSTPVYGYASSGTPDGASYTLTLTKESGGTQAFKSPQ